MQMLRFLLPQVLLFLTAVLVFGSDLVGRKDKKWLPGLAFAGSLLSLGAAVALLFQDTLPKESILGGMIAVDAFTIFFQIFAAGVSGLVILIAADYMRDKTPYRGEFYVFVLLASFSISLLASSADLVMAYISFELLSIASYILTGYLRNNPRSSEAAIKYFLYGAVASAVMLFGMSLLYGATGSTNLVRIGERLAESEAVIRWAVFPALTMLLAGFGYKIAAVPFHQWSPDAYEGAPTPVTAFLAVGSIAGGFAVMIRVLVTALPDFTLDWTALLMAISMMSMTLGNMVALSQKNIKRMLAYSGIAHGGYMLIGLISWDLFQSTSIFDGLSGVLLYLLVYLVANLGAFAVVIAFELQTKSNEIEDYSGLIKRSPLLAGTMVIFLLSLIGIPGTGGFIGKFLVFGAAMRTEFYALALVAIINSVIAGFYYLNIIRYMFFQAEDDSAGTTIQIPGSLTAVIVFSCVFTIVMGIFAQPFITFVQSSLSMFSF